MSNLSPSKLSPPVHCVAQPLQDDLSSPSHTRLELSRDAWVDYYPHFLSDRQGHELMSILIQEEEWEQRTIQALGREVIQPRLMSWGGKLPYRYSGQTLPIRPVHPALTLLWERVEERCGQLFNHIVLNYYRDGSDHMGMHADDEVELGQNPLIAAVSLGIKRTFRLEPKHRRSKKGRRWSQKHKLNLDHGSLMVMGGDIQHRWRHGVPKIRGHASGERINITFRKLLGSPGEVERVRWTSKRG